MSGIAYGLVEDTSPGVAKVWVHQAGAHVPVIALDYGLTCITDNGVGDYTYEFDRPFSTVDYSISFTGDEGGGNGSRGCQQEVLAQAVDTLRIQYHRLLVSAQTLDPVEVSMQLFGDL